MKTVFKFALMGFAASVLALSCSKSDTTPEGADNPNYDSEKNTVNANFVFNVSTGNTPITKMTSTATQALTTENFRGISDAQLFAYKLGTSNDGKWITTATKADKTYGLGTVLTPNQIKTDGTVSHRVLELALPVETNALMFWGKAPQSGSNPDNEQGKITFSAANATIGNHSFSLVERVASGSAGATALDHWEDMLSKLINAVVGTHFTAAAGTISWNGQTNDGNDGRPGAIDIYWGDFVNVDATTGDITPKTVCPFFPADPISPAGESLADAFDVFNTVYQNEVRAGSGSAIHYMMKDLYGLINKIVDDAQMIPTSLQEQIVKEIATAIQNNITKIIDANGDPQPTATLKTNAGVTYSDVTSGLDAFPDGIAAIGLPKGTAQLKATPSATAPYIIWSYEASIRTTLTGGTTTIYNIMYPAEICYFGNSPVRVTDEEVKAAEYPEGVTNWDTDASWTSKNWAKNAHVKSTTRSVAMQFNINYGTALLKTKVDYVSGLSQLEDNNAAIQLARTGATEANKKINVASGLFTLTGILVGGQPKEVGWNYLPKDNTFSYTIYDKVIVDGTVPTGANNETYTLVWDNYNSTLGAAAQSDVLVALEFTNNAGDFWGKDNLVRNGGTFYLVGKLDPKASGLAAITFPTNYALPPYNADGSTIEATRVFIQDYMTTANFYFDATSLQKAYVTVPDLRSTQISLGLSVDLKWSTGLVFDSILGAD